MRRAPWLPWVLLLVGCASDVQLRREAMERASAPLDERIAVAPIRYSQAADQARVDRLHPGERQAMGDRLIRLQDRIVADLNDSCPPANGTHVAVPGVWPDATPPRGAEGGAAGGQSEPPEPPGAREIQRPRPTNEMLDAARAAGAEVLLVLDLDAVDLAWMGRNDWFYLNLFVWFMWLVPSWYIADEQYGLIVEGEVRLFDVNSGRQLPADGEAFPIRVETALAVDDFDRGWSVLGIFTAPESLGPADWEQVADYRSDESPDAPTLLDQGTFEARVQVVDVARQLPTLLASPDVEERRATVHAVCTGISAYREDARLAALPGRPDAEAVARALIGAGVAERNVSLLVDQAATRDAFLATLREVGSRGRPGDILVLYFAGYGTTAADREGGRDGFLLFHDADPTAAPHLNPSASRRTGCLSLEDLGVALRGVRPLRCLVLVDASFAGASRHGRTFAADTPADPSETAEQYFGRVLVPGKEVILVAAGRPQDTVLDLAGAGHGLFTSTLLGCLALSDTLVDLDGNGKLDIVGELFPYLEREVRAEALIDGVDQLPVRVGTFDPATPHWLSVAAGGAAAAR